MLMRAHKPNQPVIPTGSRSVFGESIPLTLECPACRATYPRQVSAGECVWCGFDRTSTVPEVIPHEFERFTR